MRIALGAIAVVFAGLVLFEVTMQPSGAERVELAVIFAMMAAASGLAAALLPALAGRSTRIVVTIFTLSLTSLLVAALGISVAAGRMFLSDHDLTLVLVVLGVALLSALGFAFATSRSLTEDLRKMAVTASRVADGDLTARTDVARADEIGALAVAIDEMAGELETDREARTRLFASVGHDLRTPLASLRAALEALRDGVAPDPDRYLASMQRDVAALNALVDDLFLLARIEAGAVPLEYAATDLAEIADEAIEVLRPVAERSSIRIRLDGDGRAVVNTGAEAVSRVVRNLLDNAIRHAPSGSTITVSVRNGRAATVTIVDEGPGFDPAFVADAFDSFTRADPARERSTGGAGLGLAIARGYVTALGGEIWAEPGPGGRVGFSLPA